MVANIPDDQTLVAETSNCQIILSDFGFYVRCTRCPYVSEYTAAKHVARQWAETHGSDAPNDGRES